MCLQGKHRQKAHGNDEQTEEQRRAHFHGGAGHYLPTVFVSDFLALQVLVHIFNQHDRPIDHGANGNCDTTQRHDVGVQALQVHYDKRSEDANRQGDNRHQR